MNSNKSFNTIIADSYRELTSLLNWFALHGPIPIIIGGWAVYFYNAYFGSIDIDIVGPSHQGRFIDLIERYERTHKYEFVPRDELGLEVTSKKPVYQKDTLIGYIEIDACSFEDPKPGSFHENPQKLLPYTLTAEKQYHREIKLEENAICYIPTKPLLTLYKIKAARDRAYDLRTKGTIMETAKTERLRGKLTKDRADIISLLDPQPKNYLIKEEFDSKAFHRLIREQDLDFALETLTELPKYNDSIQLYNPTINSKQIQNWIKKISK
jgi:hypothetical protein